MFYLFWGYRVRSRVVWFVVLLVGVFVLYYWVLDIIFFLLVVFWLFKLLGVGVWREVYVGFFLFRSEDG